MKKTILTSVLTIVILASWFSSRPAPHEGVSASPASETQNRAGAQAQPVASLQAIRAEPSRAPVDLTRALQLAPTRQEFDREYANYRTRELEKALADSKKTLQSQDLVAKSNRGALNEDELVTLLVEMRRQSVLSRILAKNRLDHLKERFQ